VHSLTTEKPRDPSAEEYELSEEEEKQQEY
jgi:hypothetical protein